MRTDDILDLVDGPAVLDIGCAAHHVKPDHPGWLHGKLRERFQVTGIDICGSNIAVIRGGSQMHALSRWRFSA
jgi:hypothetical protein